jgi:hypothetical protein
MSDAVLSDDSLVNQENIQVFRFEEVPTVHATGEEEFWITDNEIMRDGFRALVDVGWLEGIEFKVLLDIPGFNLTYGRLKPGFTVPLHQHHGKGVYFVISGEAIYGNVILGVGDGIYQPPLSPYTLTAGEAGLEIMEIRTTGGSETMFLSKSPKYWENVLKKTVEARKTWNSDDEYRFGVCKEPAQ